MLCWGKVSEELAGVTGASGETALNPLGVCMLGAAVSSAAANA